MVKSLSWSVNRGGANFSFIGIESDGVHGGTSHGLARVIQA